LLSPSVFSCLVCSFVIIVPPPPSSTLFPYTTLFRSTVTVPTFSLNVEKVGGSIDYSTGLYSNEDIDFEDLAVILKVIVEPVASRMGQEYLINIPERTITYKGYAANNISIKEVLEYEIDTDTGFVESPIVPEDVELPKYVIFEAAVREIRQTNIASISV